MVKWRFNVVDMGPKWIKLWDHGQRLMVEGLELKKKRKGKQGLA